MVRRIDPTRPRLFAEGYGHFKKYAKDAVYNSLEITSWHYPGMATVDQRSKATKKPLLFDEYCHGNCYNREEIATDPGLRDRFRAARRRCGRILPPAGPCGDAGCGVLELPGIVQVLQGLPELPEDR